MQGVPLFSIVVPAYNVKAYVPMCLNSLRHQTFNDWEVICVNDGSTDGTGLLLDEIAREDKRFHIIHQVNRGVGFARNVALQRCCGRYIVFVDADDTLSSNALEFLKSLIDEHKADIIGYAHEEVATQIVISCDISKASIHCIHLEEPSGLLEGATLALGRFISWNCCVRADIIKGISFPLIPNGEDIVWGVKCFLRAKTMVMTDAKLYNYLCRDGSAVRTPSLRHITSSLESLSMIVACLRKDSRFPIMRRLVKRRALGMLLNYIVEKASDITGTDRRLAFSEILDTGYHLFANGTLSGTYLESMYFKVVFSSYSLFMSSLLMPYRAIECLRSCFRRKGS